MDISTIPQENVNIEATPKTTEPAELADDAKAPDGPNEVDKTTDLDQAINLTETALPTSD